MHDQIRVRCRECGKWVKLVSVTAGIVRHTIVNSVMAANPDDPLLGGPFLGTEGSWEDRGIFCGFQCSECGVILAVDGTHAVQYINQYGFRSVEAMEGVKGLLVLVEHADNSNTDNMLFIRKDSHDKLSMGYFHIITTTAMANALKDCIATAEMWPKCRMWSGGRNIIYKNGIPFVE